MVSARGEFPIFGSLKRRNCLKHSFKSRKAILPKNVLCSAEKWGKVQNILLTK